MKKRKCARTMSRWMRRIAALALMAALFYVSALDAEAATGNVTADTAKIRSQASTDSDVVGSTTKGQKIDILEAVKDSSGTVWYKVSVTGGYGYIRSDLVETSESIEVTTAQQSSQSTGAAEQPAETVPTSIGEQAATISTDGSAKIRSGASTKHSVVTSLPKGTAITLVGEANDSAGNKWYQITCNYNGKTVEGYVRSDLISIGGASEEGAEASGEGEGGENPEGEAPAEGEGDPWADPEENQDQEHRDYEVVYTQNESGEYEYYLYDNVNGNRQKLGELLSAVPTANEKITELAGQVDKGKIIIIILAVVIVLLVIAITVLLLKIRSLYYDDEYEYEDEEEEEEPEPARKTRKRASDRSSEEDREPAGKKKSRTEERTLRGERSARSERSERSDRGERGGEKPRRTRRESSDQAELHAASERPARKQPPRKAQNFLVDDDEFEFEFLNMDDKDL